MNQPLNSPNLNLIENLWSYLKRELYKRFPDTPSLKGSPETIGIMLCQCLHEVQWDVEKEALEKLINSIPNYVDAMLRAKGWYTRY